jgi:hypothetical protein
MIDHRQQLLDQAPDGPCLGHRLSIPTPHFLMIVEQESTDHDASGAATVTAPCDSPSDESMVKMAVRMSLMMSSTSTT